MLEDSAGALALVLEASSAEVLTLLVCCDGVGGHQGGAMASAIALQTILASLAADLTAAAFTPQVARGPDSVRDAIARALGRANQAVLAQAATVPRLARMGTTTTCAVLHDGCVDVGWAGDSRAYLSHAGAVHLVTRDHRAADELVANGLLDPAEVAGHPAAHVITQWLGQARGFAPSFARAAIQAGDKVLLCTDGLTDVLTDADLARMLDANAPDGASFLDLPRALVRRALQAGADDNVTVVCAELPGATVTRAPDPTWTESYTTRLAELHRPLPGDHTDDNDHTRVACG